MLDPKTKFIPNFVTIHPVTLEMKQADRQVLLSLYATQAKQKRLTDVAALTTLARRD